MRWRKRKDTYFGYYNYLFYCISHVYFHSSFTYICMLALNRGRLVQLEYIHIPVRVYIAACHSRDTIKRTFIYFITDLCVTLTSKDEGWGWCYLYRGIGSGSSPVVCPRQRKLEHRVQHLSLVPADTLQLVVYLKYH